MERMSLPVHNMTIGAARSSDLDEPAIVLHVTKTHEMIVKVRVVSKCTVQR